jgi:hypothetical protein
VRGLSADVDIGFDDVFDLLGDGELFAMMGHFEARHGRLALFTDALGVVVDVEADGKIVRDRVDADAEADFDLASIELGAAYRILERERFTFEMLAGARYTHAHTGIDLDLSAEIGERDGEKDSSHDFVDPFIGGRGSTRRGPVARGPR